MQHHHEIPGTTLFDGKQAEKGLALNRMCFSFNSAANRAAFSRTRMPTAGNMVSMKNSVRRCAIATYSK